MQTMRQKATLTIMAWISGQLGLMGVDLSVLGTVVGVDGLPLKGHISVVSSGPDARTDHFRTNSDGSFSFVMEFSERMLVVAAATGYASEEYEIASQPESQKIKIDFTLPLTGTVGGRVLDSFGRPQPGASVRIRYLDRKRRVHMGHGVNAKVDDGGAFTIFSVARGRPFVVDAVGDPWLPASSTVQVLNSEYSTGILVNLTRRGHRVHGKVTDASGDPLSNLVVRIRVKGGEVIGNEEAFSRARLQRTRTDAEGRYEFRGLPRGNAVVVATRPGTLPVKEERDLKEKEREPREGPEGDATEVDFVIP